jgi:hypothetical protein
MVKKPTWILLALFAALAGFALFLKYNPKSGTTETDATPSVTVAAVEFLFPAQAGVVTSLRIEGRDGQVIGLERGDEAWAVTQPIETEAIQASAEEAASQVTALTVLNRLDLDLAAAGLKSPAYTITVGFSNGKFHIARVGDVTPTDSGYYVRKEDGSVLVIDKYGMDALLNLLLYPPYEETPTPAPIPATETPTPSVEATPTVTKAP